MTALKKLVLCGSLWLLAAAPQQKQTTIRVTLSTEQTAELTFDPARVSAAQVRRWMQVSRFGARYNEPMLLESCDGDDPRYVECEKYRRENRETLRTLNVHNAQLNLDKTRAVIRELNPRDYPPALSEVVSYLRRRQSFWLWLDTQQLAFYKTGEVAVLESRFEQIDPKRDCGSVLGQISNAKSRDEAWHLARYDWNNCLVHAGEKQFGPYPQEAWKSFLAAYGIREHIIFTIEED